MTKEILQKKTCKELRNLAKDFNIVGRWEMKKEELINEVLKSSSKEELSDEKAASKSECEKTVDVCDDKMRYVQSVKIGTIIAFELPDKRVKSAKVTDRSDWERVLSVETEYGAEFVVPFESVLWVKTGKRWPRGIYELLKRERGTR